MCAFFTAEFTFAIHRPMNIIFTILRIPVLFTDALRAQVDDVNIILSLLGFFQNSNAVITGVEFLDRLFLLFNCLDSIFGLGFLGFSFLGFSFLGLLL